MATKILLIRETPIASIISDTYTAISMLGVVGIGIWFNSPVLQALGGLIWIMWGFARAVNSKKICTISEARAKLDEWEHK